jgi:hypothetical protein
MDPFRYKVAQSDMAGLKKMLPVGFDQGSIAWAQLKDVTDNELMRQFASGNHDAFAVIVDRVTSGWCSA